MNMNENNFFNNGNNMMDMNLMNNMMMNNSMMNNMMMNNMMNMNMNQMNDFQKEKNELIIKLVNQNNTLGNLIEKNNNKIKKIVENQILEKNEYESYEEIYYLDLCKIEFFPNYKCEKINIVFEKTTGLILAMNAPIYASVKELLMAFYIKLQIILTNKSKIVYELKDYYFIYNGTRISLDEKRTISDYGILPNSKIIFGDNKNINGGK